MKKLLSLGTKTNVKQLINESDEEWNSGAKKAYLTKQFL
jgi:hypothetical protein